ncbi:class I SAM-dependent methyltransferase [Rhodospirillum centenum]|uniref:Ribosomal RNA small subunit methyltransferase C n=1 Tax=Rhodospirillum centenum (strain ATCC 51521 / SW) TaxID=414684 RepID=B6ISG0_RHOCS|nr:class I SAM-dependent methyltransferase [Rhodospirillum centenum]ACI98396.1 ribosomal RNA small subunit methyltransferase C [Rhodospirillum centenum SW]
MNSDVPGTDGSWLYYDSDYPAPEEIGDDPALRAMVARQGVLHDAAFYRALAERSPGPVLELGCGSGRITRSLAAYAPVTAVDIAAPMLDRLRARLEREPEAVRARVTPVRADAATLDLPRKDHTLVVWAFNGLNLVPDAGRQLSALVAAVRHLAPGGRLALDVVNPLVMPLNGQAVPEVSFTRTRRDTGNPYSKIALVDPMDAAQVQRIHGWYDEVLPDASVRRVPYGFDWRLVFRFELGLMLSLAGLRLELVAGGFRGEPFEPHSPKIVMVAVRG